MALRQAAGRFRIGLSMLPLLLPLLPLFTAAAAARPILNPATVAAVNADPTATWTAGMSPRFAGMSFEDAQRMLGVTSLLEEGEGRTGVVAWGPRPSLKAPPKAPPTAFDARDYWNGKTGKGLPGFNCSTMVTVENQGGCGSCWAFGSVEAFQDRTCVASKGKISVIMATQEPTSCVGCMKKSESGKSYDPEGFNASCTYNGCGGGSPHTAWEFMGTEGVVSAECWPYGGGNISEPVFDPKHNKTVSKFQFSSPSCTARA